MAGWHKAMATDEEELRALNDRIHDLQATNEGLQKELADAATRVETAQNLSVNTTLELERLVKTAWAERDEALGCAREAEEATKKSFQSMKRYEDARELFKNKADNLTVDLAKANAELKLHLETLEKGRGGWPRRCWACTSLPCRSWTAALGASPPSSATCRGS